VKTKNKLTPKQSMFCKEYLIDLNATQAAIRAGYSEKTSGRIGQENLQKPVIQETIQKSMDKRSKKIEITSDRILEEVARVAYQNIQEFYNEDGTLKPLHELPEDVARTIASIEITEKAGSMKIGGEEGLRHVAEQLKKIKTYDKMKALELLGKYKNLFTDKIDHKHTGNFTLRYGHRDKPREQ